MNELRKDDGNVFATEMSCKAAITKSGMPYRPVKLSDDGWIGVLDGGEEPVEKVEEQPKDEKKYTKDGKRLYRCKVYRVSGDEQNRDLVISVCGNKLSHKKVFMPGQEVWLDVTHLDILNNSVVEHDIPINPDSGVYESPDPISTARSLFPEFNIYWDRKTNLLMRQKRTPNFNIEYMEDRP